MKELMAEIARIDSSIVALRETQISLVRMAAKVMGYKEDEMLEAFKKTSKELAIKNGVDW